MLVKRIVHNARPIISCCLRLQGEKQELTKLYQGVNGPDAAQDPRELILLYVVQPLVYCIGKQLVHTQ